MAADARAETGARMVMASMFCTTRSRSGTCRPGRPCDLAKLEAILDEAHALFLERDVTATSMDAVAERASVSKMTVYENFLDKPALLSAAKSS
jgi:AcrR family transcriptional regulator